MTGRSRACATGAVALGAALFGVLRCCRPRPRLRARPHVPPARPGRGIGGGTRRLELVRGPRRARHGGRGRAARHRRRSGPARRAAVASVGRRRPGPARAGDDPVALRAERRDGDAVHWVRLYDVLLGDSRISAAALPDAALVAWGETTGAPRAGAARIRPPQRAPRDDLGRPARAADPHDARAHRRPPRARRRRPRARRVRAARSRSGLLRLRAQIAHTDLTVDNTLTDESGRITGVIGIGDMSHTALITDVASVLDSLGDGREGPELPAWPGWCSTATSAACCSRTSSSRCSACGRP